jgi:hypothetical protein
MNTKRVEVEVEVEVEVDVEKSGINLTTQLPNFSHGCRGKLAFLIESG